MISALLISLYRIHPSPFIIHYKLPYLYPMRVLFNLIRESFRFALTSLVANKLRTFLSLLGITIGIFTITSVFTVTDGLESNIRSSIQSLGENVLFVQKWPWAFGGDYPWWKYLNRPQPSLKEEAAIRHRSQLARAVVFVAGTQRTIKYQNNSVENAEVTAASHDYQEVKSFDLQDGRYFTDDESAAGRPVCILGASICESLFNGLSPINKRVSLMGRRMRVVGVFSPEGTSLVGSSNDNTILIPATLARSILDLRSDRMNPAIWVKARPGVSNAELGNELTGILRSLRKLHPSEEDDFALNETVMLSQGFDGLFSVISLTGWIIGMFSIIVGGFGIANIMFVSVRERTPQIGIQKALGAKRAFILLQFLIESVVLSLVGGILGLGFIFIGTLLASGIFDFDIGLTWYNIGLALFISTLIGLISGIVPSLMASRLDPVEAMRYS